MRKPIVEAKPVSMFGDFTEEELGDDPNVPDRFFIPGYSDRRRDRELAILNGEKADPLNFRLQCARTTNGKDNYDKSKAASYMAKGYRFLQWDESRKYGLNLDKSAFTKGADGSVRLGETVVMVCDAKDAARNLRAVENAGNDQLMGALARAESRAGAVTQMAPQIEEPAAKK